MTADSAVPVSRGGNFAMDQSPTALFDSYESDFHQVSESIRAKLEDEAKNQQGEQRKATLRRVDREVDEADEMISQMEVEIQGMPQSIRQPYQSRLKNAKANLVRQKKQAKDLFASTTRAELFGTSRGSPISDDPYAASDRARLLSGTALLEEGTRRLEDSHRIALDTEAQGAEILRNLRGQREQIENSRNTLDTADSSIDRASGTLKKMIRRMYQQRFVTVAIIVVLVVLIILILYFKLR